MSVFMFSGFVKGIPMELEEAALIDGCNPLTMYIKVVFPILKPISITVAILNAMWVWNDYLLPYLLIGTKYRTIPVAIQYLKSGYGSIDYGHLMAAIVVALIPIVVFYFEMCIRDRHHTSDAEADDLFRVCHGSYQLLPGIRSGYADDKGRTGTFLIRSRTLSVSECIPVLQAWLCMRDRISAVLYRYGCYRV